MRRDFSALTSVALAIAFGGMLIAQAPATPVAPTAAPQPPPPATTKPPVNRQVPASVKVDIVLSRTNGSKTLSSLPYSLNVTEGNATHLRLGSQVPIPSGGPAFSYQNVGTSIDCDVRVLEDGRYRVALTMDDSSVADSTSPSGVPVIRSYRVDNLLVVRNAETTTFNMSTDKVSGDTIRAQVTVTALK
jgi:hypothetical protein